MKRVTLVPLRRACGESKFAAEFEVDPAHRTTKYFAVRWSGKEVGWTGYRYLPKNRSRRSRTVHIDGTCIYPDFRGQGLQRAVLRAILRNVRGNGTFPVTVCTYINAENLPSLRNRLADGLRPTSTTLVYGNVFINLEGVF